MMAFIMFFGRLFSVKKEGGYLRGNSKLALAPLSPRCLFVVVVICVVAICVSPLHLFWFVRAFCLGVFVGNRLLEERLFLFLADGFI
jgi:prepilin signal peptidase PulO-like enzyme (type II secretory pathway)